MAKADATHSARAPQSYAKRMCTHVAYALVGYTLMLIFVTAPAMHSSTSIFPYFILVLFVGLAIPLLRNLEHKWRDLEKSELSVGSLDSRFSMDRVILWVAALAVPIALRFLITTLAAIF